MDRGEDARTGKYQIKQGTWVMAMKYEEVNLVLRVCQGKERHICQV